MLLLKSYWLICFLNKFVSAGFQPTQFIPFSFTIAMSNRHKGIYDQHRWVNQFWGIWLLFLDFGDLNISNSCLQWWSPICCQQGEVFPSTGGIDLERQHECDRGLQGNNSKCQREPEHCRTGHLRDPQQNPQHLQHHHPLHHHDFPGLHHGDLQNQRPSPEAQGRGHRTAGPVWHHAPHSVLPHQVIATGSHKSFDCAHLWLLPRRNPVQHILPRHEWRYEPEVNPLLIYSFYHKT